MTPSDRSLDSTRAFFAPRAATWDDRFPDDEPAYADAIAALRPTRGGVTIDLGCGTGRALPLLWHAVAPDGVVVGIDVTPEMLHVARHKRRVDRARLMLADAMRLPIAAGTVDAILAAGLVAHVPDPRELLRSLHRSAAPGCRLALFHPVGRAALARRHHRVLTPDELLDPRVLPSVLATAGWTVEYVDDAEHRYLALAHKASRE